MQLKHILIRNFRSIDEIQIELNDRCKILLGINETGKTNILDAINALSDNFIFDISMDAKIPTGEPYKFLSPKIEYTFEFSPEEKISILEEVFGEDHKTWPFDIGRKAPKVFASELINNHSYIITLNDDNTKTSKMIYTINSFIIKPKKNFFIANSDVTIVDNDNEYTLKANEIQLLKPSDIDNWDAIKTSLNLIDKKAIVSKLSSETCNYMDDNLPDVIYWKYDDSMLLTEPVPIQGFIDNPETSIPLKSIFHLAGIEDIKDSIEKVLHNDSLFHNLLKTLSDRATKHLRETWKDYRDIDIILKEKSERISVLVKDKKNLYNFKQRSDGFKRFISFLFILSAQSKTNSIPENTIILMDEPDISLHPSGIKHLLSEVLRISNENYCFVASHSIFFIDRDNISRHIIVEKENECTTIKSATYQNFTDEEVLHNALGTSVFDILKKTNLFFEGWTDKEVFSILVDLYKDDIEDIDNLDKLGICWSSSANKICDTIRPLLWDKERFFLIVSDHDGQGKNEKKKFEKEFSWSTSIFYTYKELSSRTLEQMSLEDLLPKSIILDLLNSHLANIETSPKRLFSKSRISGGIINSWNAFVNQYYKANKSALVKGYKKSLPDHIRRYIDETGNEKAKDEFKYYKHFLVQVFEKLNSI